MYIHHLYIYIHLSIYIYILSSYTSVYRTRTTKTCLARCCGSFGLASIVIVVIHVNELILEPQKRLWLNILIGKIIGKNNFNLNIPRI